MIIIQMTKVFNGFNIFLLFMIMLGCILVTVTVKTQEYIKDSCVLKSNINNSMNFILMLGIMLIVLSFTYFVCNIKCKCKETNVWYKSILACIGIILAVCGAIVLDGVKDCDSPEVKNYGLWMMVSGIVLPVLLLIYHYNLPKKLCNSLY